MAVKHTLTVQVSESVYTMLKSMADEDGTSRVHIIRKAIKVLWEIRKYTSEDTPIELKTGEGEVKMLIL